MARSPKLDSVLDVLGSEIIGGTHPAHTVFTLQKISERFDISRTVAREVMRALEQLGLVAASRRVGLTVQPQDNWQVLNPLVIDWRLRCDATRLEQLRSLSELRRAVEPAAAALAAQVASADIRAELVEQAVELIRLGSTLGVDSPEFMEADVTFHHIVMTASGNEFYDALAPSVLTVIDVGAPHSVAAVSANPPAMNAHLKMAEAIARGDAEAAAEHTRHIQDEVLASLMAAEG